MLPGAVEVELVEVLPETVPEAVAQRADPVDLAALAGLALMVAVAIILFGRRDRQSTASGVAFAAGVVLALTSAAAGGMA